MLNDNADKANNMRKLYLIALLCALAGSAFATHIVGGELNYTCLGNNQYEITLVVFRDCYNGSPNAYFDDPASIGIFDRTNKLLQEIRIPLMGDDTLSPVLSNPCLVVPPNVCVHTTTYRTVVNLPPIIGGYQIAYQRCCRNQTLANIIDPLATGATYMVEISEKALLECNSNPKFQQWPPIYICANEPISFDQSAIDADGDSIVYRLCTPLTGADQVNPQPQPPNNPPYAPVTWIDPPYGVSNMLNGSPGGEPLQIDLHTGLLTGLPNTVGQFVVGICVEEYRDGELISTTRRDFQYNVGVCGEATAAFFAPEIQCTSLTVQFLNESQGGQDYIWYFNDPANPGATSTEENPAYAYADTGLYTVTLIADPAGNCRDTFERTIHLLPASLVADFSYEATGCSDTLWVQFTDLSTDAVSTPVEWTWTVNPGGFVFHEQHPLIPLTKKGTASVGLLVTAANGCQVYKSVNIPVNLIDDLFPAEPVIICPGDEANLNPVFNPDYTYNWSPAAGLDDPGSPNPLASPDESTVYQVTVTDPGSECVLETQVAVIVPPYPDLLPEDSVTCSPEVSLGLHLPGFQQVSWATNPGFNPLLGTGPDILVSPLGYQQYYVRGFDEFRCPVIDSIGITGNGVNLKANEPDIICLGANAVLSVANQDPQDTLTYQWSPSGPILSSLGYAVVVKPQTPGEQLFTVTATNQFGCSVTDSILLSVIDTGPQEATFTEVQCAGYEVMFNTTSVNGPFYIWAFGDPEDPDARAEGADASHTYPGPGTYQVMIYLSEEAPCRDTIFRTVNLGEPAFMADFTWEITHCSDSVQIAFHDASQSGPGGITGWNWDLDNGVQAQSPDTSIVLTAGQNLEVSLALENADGCRDTARQVIPVNLIQLTLADTLANCNGNGVALNPGGDPDLVYVWSPAAGLDDPSSPNPVATPDVPTGYEVMVSDSAGLCSIMRSTYVNIPPSISYELAQDGVICEEDFLLFALSNQDLAVTWATDPEFQSVLGTGDSLPVQAVKELNPYFVRLTDPFGCSVEDSLVILNRGIKLEVDGVTICVGDTARLTAVNLSNFVPMYQWGPAEAILEGQGSASVLVSPPATSDISLHVSNEFGCVLDTLVEVNVFNFRPPLAITADRDTLIGPGDVQLNATEDAEYSYSWTPDPALSALDISDPEAYLAATREFSLTIRNKDGCSNQAAILIVVLLPECEEPYIFIPNAFTPNGDGSNDVLAVRGLGIQDLYLTIFDRWGERVFETRSQDDTWDGTFKGEKLPPDVYGFYLELTCWNGETFRKKGNITLLR